MGDLRELTTDAKRLYEALGQLLEQQDEKRNIKEIDFTELWITAKSRPFTDHILDGREEHIQKKYLKLLSGLVALCLDDNLRMTQIRFLARILVVCNHKEYGIQELISDGMMLSTENISDFFELEDEEMQQGLLVDLLLMCYLNGQPEEKQLDYTIGYLAMLGLLVDKTKAIGQLVKGLLEKNDELVLEQNRYMDVTAVRCYMKNPPDGVLVKDIEEAEKVKSRKIIFYDMTYQNLQWIDFDAFYADVVVFRNCKFINIQGIKSLNKKLIFEDCIFNECTVEENLLILKNAEIRNCAFDNIVAYEGKEKYLICLQECVMKNTKFDNVRITQKSDKIVGFIAARDTDIVDCIFQNVSISLITIVGNHHLCCIEKGVVKNCSFDTIKFIGGKDYYYKDLLAVSHMEIVRNVQYSKITACSSWRLQSEYLQSDKLRKVFECFA